jgi:hypothetical protein
MLPLPTNDDADAYAQLNAFWGRRKVIMIRRVLR